MSGLDGRGPVGHGRSGWDVFNPRSDTFHEAEKIFHEDLSKSTWHWRQAVVVIASVIGGLFFIVGAFPLFCWTAKWLKTGEDKSAGTVTQATKNFFSKKEKREGIEKGSGSTQTTVLQPAGDNKPGNNSKRVEEGRKGNGDLSGAGGAGGAVPARDAGRAESAKKAERAALHPKADEIALGKAHWETYFGDVGEVPALPANIEDILMEECPIFKGGKKVWETHMLVLVPEKVDGAPLTVVSLGKLVRNPKPSSRGHASGYRYFSSYVPDECKTTSVKSHWVLITKNVIPESRKESYTGQKTRVGNFKDEKDNSLYEVPTLRDMAVCLFMHHVGSGDRLFSDKPWTHTRCQDLDKDGCPVFVGGFALSGVGVYNYDYFFDDEDGGVAASRKF